MCSCEKQISSIFCFYCESGRHIAKPVVMDNKNFVDDCRSYCTKNVVNIKGCKRMFEFLTEREKRLHKTLNLQITCL